MGNRIQRLQAILDSTRVPAGAVAQGQAGDYAWVVKDGAAELRPLTVLEAGEREVVVAKGLAAGEVVVVEGQLKLIPGAKVDVRPKLNLEEMGAGKTSIEIKASKLGDEAGEQEPT